MSDKGKLRGLLVLAAVMAAGLAAARDDEPAATPEPFDGRPWHVSTGNLSVLFIQASPIGAFPKPGFIEPPPTVESQVALKAKGLVANEDYIAWGAVEREPGKWDWAQHDAMERTLHEAGLEYVVYDWVHFPPTWLRDAPGDRTLMRCLEHGEETNYLSIFDPRTIEWYDHFYKNLHAHFGDRIDAVYACILGPYGEGITRSWSTPGSRWATVTRATGAATATRWQRSSRKWASATAATLPRSTGRGGRRSRRSTRCVRRSSCRPRGSSRPRPRSRRRRPGVGGWTSSRGTTRRSSTSPSGRFGRY